MANGIIGKVTAGGGTHLVTSTFYGTCATAAGTAAKIVKLADATADAATAIVGMTLAVKFTNSNTVANPTLTVQRNGNTTNLIAATSIKAYGTTAPGTTVATSWRAGAVVLFVYVADGSNYYWTQVSSLDDNTTYTIPSAGTSATAVSTTASGGSATTWSKSDHVHSIALATGDNNGQVKIAGSNVSVKGLGTAAYTASTDYATSGHTHDKSTITSVYEANLVWGGKNFSGAYGCLDAAMVDALGANRLMFAKAAGITIEYSRDNGSTWTDYGASNSAKVGLFSSGYGFVIGKADSSNKATANGTNYQLRVTLDTGAAQVYTVLNKFVLYVNTNGSNNCTVTIDKALQSSPTTYTNVVNNIPITGWSGYNVINVDGITTYGYAASSQYGRIRFTFKANGGNTNYPGLNINQIMGFGGVGWATPSTMAKTGHLYSFDADQNATFPAGLSATTIDATKLSGTIPSSCYTNTTYTFDGTYNASTNKAATVSTVTNAINALDGNLNSTTPGAGKTLTAFSQTDGKINATFGNISITKSQISDFPNYAGSSSAGGAATSLANFKVTTTTNLWAVDSPTTNAIGYQSGLTKANWNYQQTDGAIYDQFYSSSWIHQIFGDYRTGQISVRGKNNGTWQAWRRVLDETNASTILGLGTLATKSTISAHSYTPAGTITLTNGNTTTTVSAASSGATTYTPGGSVSQPTFTGSSLTSTGNFTPAGSVSVSTNATTNKTATVSAASSGDTTYTPGGTNSAPAFTGTAATIVVNGGTGTATYTPAGTIAVNGTTSTATVIKTATFNTVVTSATVANEILTISTGASGSSTNQTGVRIADPAYKFTGTGTRLTASYTPAGSVAAPTFTGTAVRLVTGNIAVPNTYTATFTGTQGSVSVSGTPAGTVSKPIFSGTAVRLVTGNISRPTSATFSGTPATLTHSIS